jgi:hypothetical protein
VFVTDKIGSGTTGADVLFAGNSSFPNSALPNATQVTIPLTLSLAPGNYFIVLATPIVSGVDGWVDDFAPNPLPSTVGSLVQVFDSGGFGGSTNTVNPERSTFVALDTRQIASEVFDIGDNAVSAPEPASVVFAAAGVLMIAAHLLSRARQRAV